MDKSKFVAGFRGRLHSCSASWTSRWYLQVANMHIHVDMDDDHGSSTAINIVKDEGLQLPSMENGNGYTNYPISISAKTCKMDIRIHIYFKCGN
jgi:hypothetical protein